MYLNSLFRPLTVSTSLRWPDAGYLPVCLQAPQAGAGSFGGDTSEPAWTHTAAQRCWLEGRVARRYVLLLPTGWQHLVKASAPPVARCLGIGNYLAPS